MKCRNCGYEVEKIVRFCPNCGERLFTPKEAQEVLGFADRLKSKIEAQIDTTPKGEEKLRNYLAVLQENIISFLKLITTIQEHQSKVRRKAKLIKNKKWQDNAKLLMIGLYATAASMPSSEIGNPKEKLQTPPGCFGLAFELDGIEKLTREFFEFYENYLTTNNVISLEKAGGIYEKIVERIGRVTTEIDKLIQELSSLRK